MEVEPSTQELKQLSAVYELLSHLWRSEADQQLLETLSQPDMKSAWEKLGGYVPDTIDDELIEDLAVDYCQLLIGPTNHVSPIQSVWQDELLQSEPVSSMQKYFKVVPDFEPAIGIPDHFAVQLQFIGRLFHECNGGENDASVMNIAKEFFSDHLSWSKEFLIQVGQRANTQFYSSLATLTHNFLHEES